MEYYSSLDASQLDSETPTLFEVISANQLEALLSPSLRYILVYYASRYPYWLLRITNRFDEINLVLRSFIEWYFLKYWQGTFTENFYGLKRVSQTPLSNGNYNSGRITQIVPSMIEERRMLTTLQSVVSVFEITGVSYLSEKFNYWYEILYPKYITNQLMPQDPASQKDRLHTELKRKFVEWYPTVQSGFKAANFITTLLYFSGNSKSPSILTYLFKINYSRLNQFDYDKNKPKLPKFNEKPNKVRPPNETELILRFITRNFLRPSWRLTKLLLGTFFPVAIFTLKFLEWYNNSDFGSKVSKNLGNVLDSVIPPPTVVSRSLKLKSEAPKKVYKSGRTCPLCHEEITNPAIIETGYVFCYSCIHNYLANSHKVVTQKLTQAGSDNDDEVSDAEDYEENEDEKLETNTIATNLDKGGRCPVTGRKLLGCRWNPLKEEWEIEGIRRLIF